ncbi:XRE family transcriptional regulator [Ursidibacter arcticus]
MQSLTEQQKEQKERSIGTVPFDKQTKGTGFSERLKKMIGNKSGRAFAKEVGISYSTLHNYLTNVSSPTLDNLIALAEATGVDMKWLATGEEPTTNENFIEKAFQRAGQLLQEGISMINGYPSINVSAGFGSFNEGVTQPEGQEPYSDALLASLGVKASNCGVFWANGTSMAPTIADNDQMLVDFSKNEVKGDNKIYLVQNGESVWVKRVKVKWEGVELISDNKEEFEPITISKEDAQNLQIIGQVVHIGHSLI